MSYLYWSSFDGRVGGLGFTFYLVEVEVEQ